MIIYAYFWLILIGQLRGVSLTFPQVGKNKYGV